MPIFWNCDWVNKYLYSYSCFVLLEIYILQFLYILGDPASLKKSVCVGGGGLYQCLIK